MTSKKKKRLSLALTFLFCILLIIPVADAATPLKKGGVGADVLLLLQQLQKLGYFKVAPTGNFGPLTETAVKKLQRDYYLNPDGIVGLITKSLIINYWVSHITPRKSWVSTSAPNQGSPHPLVPCRHKKVK